MNDNIYDPTSIQVMTGPGVRWTEPIEPVQFAPVLEQLDNIMRHALTTMGYQ